MAYIHGAYGEVGKTQAQNAIQSSTVACYIGTAPIHLIRGWKDKDLVNRPIKLTNWRQAVQTLGYNKEWQNFNLCEAMKVHFDNPLGNVGPIYVINVFDPSKYATTNGEATLTFVNGRAEIADEYACIVIDSIALADKAEGVDYSVDYDFTSGKIVFTALKDELTTAAVTYKSLTPNAWLDEAASLLVGGVSSSGRYSGIAAAERIYNEYNDVVTLYAVPCWSKYPAVRNALVKACQKMNGHWYAYCFTDIDWDIDSCSTIEDAIAWKKNKGYTSQYETPCWPKVEDNEGNVFSISTLSVWRQMLVDASHNGVPFETASNKAVPGVKQSCVNDIPSYDKERANALNENGIRTVVPDNGQLVLWGGHTGAYTYGATSDALQIFDTNVRMIGYVLNSFQREWGSRIDEPMTLQLKDEIMNREQDKLDSLVAQGALIGEPTISFFESENSTTDLMNGDFEFDHICTPTPQLKSATATVSYTDAGFSVYTATEE